MAAAFTVTTTADSGPGSLRQAMADARATPGTHTITFAIPGEGPHVIAPTSTLPALTSATSSVSLDGCSQAGTICGSNTPSPRVQIRGSVINVFWSPEPVSIRGLSITGAPRAISMARSAVNGEFRFPDGLTIEDNFVGLTPARAVEANVSGAVCRDILSALRGPAHLTIKRNVFGGNTTAAVAFTNNFPFASGAGLTSNLVIADNSFGVDPAGQPVGSGATAISIGATVDARITGNLLAGSTGTLLAVTASNSGLLIAGNEISGAGVDGIGFTGGAGNAAFVGPVTVTGNSITGNARHGISTTGANGLTIGGTASGAANLISGNGGAGVAVGLRATDSDTRVTVRGNSIDGNGSLGIDLAGDGVTANGPTASPRTGPNSLVNYPVLERIERGSTRVIGSYVGLPNATYALDFYLTASRDASGYGEGAAVLGSADVATDAAGRATFDVTFPSTIAAGGVVTATATDAAGNTSEYSQALSVGPLATDDRARTSVDEPVTIRPAANDTPGDAPIDPASVQLLDPVTGESTTSVTLEEGEVTVAPDGSVTFTPAEGLSGTVTSVQYSVADSTGARSAAANLTLVIGPSADDLDTTTEYRTPTDVVVPTDGIAAGSAFDVDSAPQHGSVAVLAGGILRYTPEAGFAGDDIFEYRVCAPAPDEMLCDTASVRVTVIVPVLTARSQTLAASAAGGTVGTVIGAGMVNGEATTALDVVASAVDAPTGIHITAGGDVQVASRLEAGRYDFRYELCLTDDPTTCAIGQVVVNAAAAQGAVAGGGLPATGANPVPSLWGGLAALLIGAALIGIHRYRRRRA